METRNRRVVAALSLAAFTMFAACVESEGTGDSDVGTITIGLSGQGASGATYRLRDATFTVAGPGSTLVWHTEDDPDRTSLSANVVVGNYSATLAPGWRMERIVMGQPPVDVAATLLSPNPALFTVNPMMRTEVPFQFAVDGSVVSMNQGYDIVIDIEEIATSIITMPSTLTLNEGASATVAVRLATAPPAPITVTVTSSDTTAVAAAPNALTFTPANFSVPQIVTVTGLQDADTANEMVTLSLSSAGLPTAVVAVIVIDDDVAPAQQIIVMPTNLTLNEGATAGVGVHLAAPPAGNVTVAVTTSDPSAIATSLTTLTFTPFNFSTPQFVNVIGLQDPDTANEMAILAFASPGVPTASVAVAVIDDDMMSAQAIVTTVASLSVTEGGTAVLGVRLAAAPPANVTVNISSSSPAAVVSPATLTFTPANFSLFQTMTVTGVQDLDAVNQALTLVLSAAGIPPTTVAVTVIDDDAQMILPMPTMLSLFEGSTATLGVRLAFMPAANVVVQVVSSDPSAATVAPTSLVFTPANWSTPQVVTVVGVEDADLFNETLQVTFASPGVPSATVLVSVADND